MKKPQGYTIVEVIFALFLLVFGAAIILIGIAFFKFIITYILS